MNSVNSNVIADMTTESEVMPKGSRVYEPMDIAKILGIGRSSAYNLCNSGAFPIIRFGRLIKVDKDTFEKWYASHLHNNKEGMLNGEHQTTRENI